MLQNRIEDKDTTVADNEHYIQCEEFERDLINKRFKRIEEKEESMIIRDEMVSIRDWDDLTGKESRKEFVEDYKISLSEKRYP